MKTYEISCKNCEHKEYCVNSGKIDPVNYKSESCGIDYPFALNDSLREVTNEKTKMY